MIHIAANSTITKKATLAAATNTIMIVGSLGVAVVLGTIVAEWSKTRVNSTA